MSLMFRGCFNRGLWLPAVVVLVCSAFPPPALPQPAPVKITGVPAEATAWLGPMLLQGKPASEIARAVTTLLADSGFFDASASLTLLPPANDTILTLAPGIRYTIASVAVNGVTPANTEPLLPLAQLEGLFYSSEAVEHSLQRVMARLAEQGFPFTRVTVAGVFRDSVRAGECLLSLRIETGGVALIDSIALMGNTVTQDHVILRELGFTHGAVYTPELLQRVPPRLNRLRFFAPVQEPRYLVTAEKKGIVEVMVTEAVTNTFDGVIGYVPANRQGEKGYVTGLASISFRNLFGTGRAAAFRWQRLNAASEDLQINYQEPWVLGFPLSLSVAVVQAKQDSSYIKRRFELGAEYFLTRELSVSAMASSETTVPAARQVPVFTVYNTSLLTATAAARFDSRNDPVSPRSGFVFSIGYSASRKKINGPSEYLLPGMLSGYALTKSEAAVKWYVMLFTSQVLALSVQARVVGSSLLEVSDLYRVGGNASLRGYRENQFLANRTVTASAEYRLLTAERSYLFLFSDLGYFYRQALSVTLLPGEEQTLTGYGAGLTTETGLGLLSVSYALGKGDSFSQGKIHFGIINQF